MRIAGPNHEEPRFAGWRLLGLGFWQAWQMIGICTDVLVPRADLPLVPHNPLLWILALTALGYLSVTAMAGKLAPFLSRRPCFLAAGGLTAIGSIAVPVSIAFGQGATGAIAFFTGTISISLGNALLLMMWGELWSTLATGRVGRHLYASYSFAFVLFFIASALPSWVAVAFNAGMPIASAAILAACRNEPRREPPVLPLDAKSIPIVRILFCVLVISIVYGLSQGIASASSQNDPLFISKAFALAGIGIAVITLSMVAAPSSTEPVALYRPIIPAMTAGIILMVLLPPLARFIGTGLIIMGVYCLDMFLMLVSTDIAFRTRIPVALPFGMSIFCARSGTLLGSMTAATLQHPELAPSETAGTVLHLGTLVLVLVGMLFFTQTDVQELYAVPRVAIDSSLEQKCASISRMCRLTNRESEVLVLLARGRTVRYICDELSIAQGTAKHHVSNIYRKVGVFDRQGLLDAIEQGAVGKA